MTTTALIPSSLHQQQRQRQRQRRRGRRGTTTSSWLTTITMIAASIVLAGNILFQPVECGLFSKDKDKNNAAVASNKNNGNGSPPSAMTDDASTGTVTELPPGVDKAPTTCNEMMARAVVIANEERAQALSERDDAVDTATRALTQIERTNVAYANLESKYDAIKMEIEETKRHATETIATAETLAKKRIAEMEQLTMERIETTQMVSRERIDKIQLETKAKIDANDIATKERIAKTMEETGEEIRKMKKEAADETLAAKIFVETANKQADEAISAAKKEAKEAIATKDKIAEEAIATAKREAAEYMEEMKNVMEKVKSDATISIEQTQTDAASKVHEAQINANKTVASVKQEAATQVSQAKFNADARIEEINTLLELTRKEGEEAIARLTKEGQQALEEMRTRYEGEVASHVEEKTRLEGQLTKALGQIEDLTRRGEVLTLDLERTTESLRVWEERETPYCNFTLIRSDSGRVLTGAASIVDREARNAWKIAWDTLVDVYKHTIQPKISSVMTGPYVTQVVTLYEEHVKETVDGVVIPAYRRHLSPVLAMARGKCNDVGTSIINKCRSFRDTTYELAVETVRTGCQSIAEKSSQSNMDLPESLSISMRLLGDNADGIVWWMTRLFVAFVVYQLRYHILDLCGYVMLLPFRLVWFFCPLRLLLSSTKDDEEDEEENVDIDDGVVRPDVVPSDPDVQQQPSNNGNGQSPALRVKEEENNGDTIRPQ